MTDAVHEKLNCYFTAIQCLRDYRLTMLLQLRDVAYLVVVALLIDIAGHVGAVK